jgi:hypothetical protein
MRVIWYNDDWHNVCVRSNALANFFVPIMALTNIISQPKCKFTTIQVTATQNQNEQDSFCTIFLQEDFNRAIANLMTVKSTELTAHRNTYVAPTAKFRAVLCWLNCQRQWQGIVTICICAFEATLFRPPLSVRPSNQRVRAECVTHNMMSVFSASLFGVTRQFTVPTYLKSLPF